MSAFSRALANFGDETVPTETVGQIADTMSELSVAVIEDSPVESGAFAGSWDIGVEQYPESVPDTTGKSASLARCLGELRLMRANLKRLPRFVVIQNLQPYAARLEFSPGFRKDGRTGWVRAAVAAAVERLKS